MEDGKADVEWFKRHIKQLEEINERLEQYGRAVEARREQREYRRRWWLEERECERKNAAIAERRARGEASGETSA